jgi:RimJ/RimL family protein N-acetyltransferase
MAFWTQRSRSETVGVAGGDGECLATWEPLLRSCRTMTREYNCSSSSARSHEFLSHARSEAKRSRTPHARVTGIEILRRTRVLTRRRRVVKLCLTSLPPTTYPHFARQGRGAHEMSIFDVATPGEQFVVRSLRGRHVVLRHVLPDDYRFLRAAELSGDLAVRWRFRGASVSPDQWSQHFWQNTLAVFLVIGAKDPTPLGLVVAYRPSFQDGHACLGAETFLTARPAPLMVFGLALFIDYVFACWNFHKLYMEVAEYNLPQFKSSIGRFVEVEGRLRKHLWYDGRAWDQLFLALYRDRWYEQSGRLLSAARPAKDLRAHVRMPPTQTSGEHTR